MESYGDLKRPYYQTVDRFISQQTADYKANKKLENSKWEQLSDDSKHYLNSMKANSKNVIHRRKLQDKVLVELLFLFQEYPDLEITHFDAVFKKAKSFYFTRSREDLPKNPKEMNAETYAYLDAHLPKSEEEEEEDSDV